MNNSKGAFGYRFWAVVLLAGMVLVISACGSRQVRAPEQSPPVAAAPPAPGTAVAEKSLTHMIGPRSVVHEVAPLETVWRLSKMYDVPMNSIYHANGLKSGDTIKIGQKLVIPNAKTLRNVIALYPSTQWKYIIIHHTATDIGNAMLIHKSHHDRGFWYGLGYHFLIDNGTLGKGDGQIEQSPRWIKQMKGAHCKAGGMNSKGIGIALVGNFNEEFPTRKQMDSLAYLVKLLCDHYRIPASRIMGHRDVNGACTDCPGKRFPWSGLRQCLTNY
ncbi:N-acetylmuramoyl-L-alanine amidase [Desulfoferrobacter suflitae]|uniref:N-acetylmuramoyl-L-alanine amidase n=1 Tax=Desulfoferrobacter suflitae TaxID=2865782 RepID=UPI002164A703|nr:N-acetylmuramoyl-L-alanine amidase [Desulfoferrobacter suflitae]MCK8601945.1 N-acetylmuramoyl-L-alanine amidase [Desulfoferrobacter suflitae]